MESEYAKSKATELRALAEFTELKAMHEMLGAVCALSATFADVCLRMLTYADVCWLSCRCVQENQALQLRRQAEQDIAASKIRQAKELRLFTAITLMDNYTSAMNLLYDEILRVRKDALEFPSNSVSLCDKMNFKQVKINSANEPMERQRLVDEEHMRDRRTLSCFQTRPQPHPQYLNSCRATFKAQKMPKIAYLHLLPLPMHLQLISVQNLPCTAPRALTCG
jgi:hypothetical protein